jgi:hypothetical protein
LTISAVIDDNAATEKIIFQSMSGGSGNTSLWDVAFWDVGYWSGESNADVGRDIDRLGKGIYFTMGVTGLDESWNMLSYTYIAKPLISGASRTREAS